MSSLHHFFVVGVIDIVIFSSSSRTCNRCYGKSRQSSRPGQPKARLVLRNGRKGAHNFECSGPPSSSSGLVSGPRSPAGGRATPTTTHPTPPALPVPADSDGNGHRPLLRASPCGFLYSGGMILLQEKCCRVRIVSAESDGRCLYVTKGGRVQLDGAIMVSSATATAR